jgi:hypothetical protein
MENQLPIDAYHSGSLFRQDASEMDDGHQNKHESSGRDGVRAQAKNHANSN